MPIFKRAIITVLKFTDFLSVVRVKNPQVNLKVTITSKYFKNQFTFSSSPIFKVKSFIFFDERHFYTLRKTPLLIK